MKQLQILVCIKQVPDPEGPADAFRIDPGVTKVVPVGIPPVISPFDENALEAALRIKDHYAVKVTAISMGEQLALPVLRKALAAGADDLILLMDQHFKDLDGYSTAYVLTEAIKRIGEYDLILTGRQAADWDFGITWGLIAEMLQIPSINFAQKVEIRNDRIVVEKLSHNGYEIIRTQMPVLVAVSSEIGELRYVSIRALQAVSKKPVKIYNVEDLEIDLLKLKVRNISKLFGSQTHRQCRFIEGESLREKGENLVIALKEERVI